MASTLPTSSVATEGKGSAESFQARASVERVGKTVAIACLNGAIESFVGNRHMSRAEFAETFCGMSEGNFSKVVNGVQGDFWALVYKLPGDIRPDFFARLHESERIDPLMAATEQLIAAAFRFLLAAGASPEKAHMAKAGLPERRRKRA